MSRPTTAASLGSLLAGGATGAMSPARGCVARLGRSRGRVEALLALVEPPALMLDPLLDPLAGSSLRSEAEPRGDVEPAAGGLPAGRGPDDRRAAGRRPAAPLAVTAARLGALPARPTAPGPVAPTRSPAVTPRDGVRPAHAGVAALDGEWVGDRLPASATPATRPAPAARAAPATPAGSADPAAPAIAAVARARDNATERSGAGDEPSLARAVARLTASARADAPAPGPAPALARHADATPPSPLRQPGAVTRAVSRALADPAAVCAAPRARISAPPDRGAVATPQVDGARRRARASGPPAPAATAGDAGLAAAQATAPAPAPNATLAAALARVSAAAPATAAPPAAAQAATSPALGPVPTPAAAASPAGPAPHALAVDRLVRTVASLEAVHGRLAALAHTAPEPVEWLDDDDALAGRLERLLTRQAQARGIDLS